MFLFQSEIHHKSPKFQDFSSLLFETVFYYRVYGKQSSSGVSWKECHPSERLSSVLIMIIQAAPSLMKSKVHFQFNACGHHHLRLMLLKFIIFTKILNDAKIFTNFIVTFLLKKRFSSLLLMSKLVCFLSSDSWRVLQSMIFKWHF